MPLVIESRPIVNIDDNNVSKWNGTFNPILYKGIRRDAVVTSILSGTSVTININWIGFVVVPPIVGEFIYLCSGPYDGAFEVVFSSTTFLILETPFITQSYGGFIDLNTTRANHHVELELYRIFNHAYILVATQVFRASPDGSFSFDVSAMLRSIIKFVNDYDYVTINKRDTNISSGFNFRYKEVWDGNPGTFSDFNDRDITYYVGAARQLQDKFGSNMGEYVPNPGSIGLFNGSFEISDPQLDGWSNVDVLSTSLIDSGQLLYSSEDDAGISTWTSDTLLTDGVEYEVIVDKEWIILATVTIIAGTNEVQLASTANKQKISITANGTAFSIRFNSVAGLQTRQAFLNSIQVYLSEVPSPAKFLVDDFEPTYFQDYPFDLAFIHSDNLVDLAINRNRRFLDQNGVEISTSVTPLDVSTNDFAVNRMIVGAVPAGTKCIEVWLDAGAAVITGYVDIGYVGGEGIDTYTSGAQNDNPATRNPQTQNEGDSSASPLPR